MIQVVSVYYAAQGLLVLVSLLLPRFNRAGCVISGLVLTAAAGMRTGGFDYKDYVDMIEAVHSSTGKPVAFQLLIVKDPLMLAVIDGCHLISNGTRPVFVIMAALAVAPKWFVARSLRNRSTVFMGVYAILLAPGLEFAAIRASVAVGFLMLLMYFYWRGLAVRWSLAVVSVFAHIAALPFLAAKRLSGIANRLLVTGLPLVIALGAYAASPIIALFPRSSEYQNNVGTAHGLLPPLGTYIAYLITTATADISGANCMVATSNMAAAIAIGLGFGLVPVAVTMAFRFLEFGWVFLVLVLVARIPGITGKEGERLSYHALALGLLLVTVVTANALRSVFDIPI